MMDVIAGIIILGAFVVFLLVWMVIATIPFLKRWGTRTGGGENDRR